MCLVRHPSRSLHESVPCNQVPKPKSSLAPPPSRLFLEQGFVGNLFSNFPYRIACLTFSHQDSFSHLSHQEVVKRL